MKLDKTHKIELVKKQNAHLVREVKTFVLNCFVFDVPEVA